jgi:hypothetical protein
LRGLVVVGLVLVALALVRPASSAGTHRVDAGHGLSIVLPVGAELTFRHFTPCADPVERFSVLYQHAVLTVEERLEVEPGPRRNGPFHVDGPATPMECCTILGRAGWSLHFRDHGRGFYANLYPSGSSPAPLLHLLDSLRVESAART